MNSILLPKNFHIQNVTFGNIKSLDNGGKTIYIGYNGKPLILQTPEMTAPFGSTKWSPTGSDVGKDKYSLEMSFKGLETSTNLQNFHNLIEQLDEKFVETALDNSTNWFKKKYNSKDVLAALYTPLLKRSKNKETGEPDDKYPPTFRINLPFKDDKIDCEIYNKEKQIIPLASIDKGSKVTAILQCLGIWVAGGKFGCSWKVIQLRVIAPEAIRGFAFNEDDDNKTTTNNPLYETSHHENSEDTESKQKDIEQDILQYAMVESSDDENDAIETTSANRKGRSAPLKKK